VCSGGGIPAAKKWLKNPKYGKSRRFRRRGAVVLVVLVLIFLALPLLLKAPDVVRSFTHPLAYEETIQSASADYALEPALVAAVIRTESGFDPQVESHKGAYGLMQIQPETARFISERSGITSDYRGPQTNIRMGAWYLRYLQNRYNGDERLALAAYNSGEGQVDQWISEKGFEVGRDIPFKETRDYVEDVLAARDTYAELYGSNLDRRPE
jgi:soluble lytic murein transglycosylase